MKVRLFVTGSLLCEAEGIDDDEAFEAVLDGVVADPRVHRSEVESLEVSQAEEDESGDALATLDVGQLVERVAGSSEQKVREEFEAEHGLDVFDCSTWPDNLVHDMIKFLDAWMREEGRRQDYEMLVMARGLELLGRTEEGDPEDITDRGRLLMLGWRAGKQR